MTFRARQLARSARSLVAADRSEPGRTNPGDIGRAFEPRPFVIRP